MFKKFKVNSIRINSLFLNRSFMRLLSQFSAQKRCDCIDVVPRVLRDHKECSIKNTGLVLGVYYNDNIDYDKAILTASAKKYNEKTCGKLWRLLNMATIPKLGDYRIFYDIDPTFAYVAVAGLGTECLDYNEHEKMDESKEAVRIAAGVGAKALQELNPAKIYIESLGNAEAAAEGAALSIWLFQEYKNHNCQKNIPILNLYDDCDFDGWFLGKQKADAQNLARFLQEMPPNHLNPTTFAKTAVELLCEVGINVEVKVQGWAEAHEMGGFTAVGKSSCQPPLYVELSYYGGKTRDRPIVMIGKGVTFDSGSLDLKPPNELKFMKSDMAGAACVMAVMRAAAILKLPINIRGLLPLCELMPNCNSARFGDVVHSANGKSVRIRLPSKEGRMIVADSLVYARNYWPKFIVDVGTMCKELEITLGSPACACYSNSEELFYFLQLASTHTGDRIWRMPLWNYYKQQITDCKVTDLLNMAKHSYSDSANCAAFLSQFICDTRWIHLDTYGVMHTHGDDFPYLRKGMTGRPTRTLIELLYQLLENEKL